MAWTQADLDELDEKIKAIEAVKATSFGDQSTTFRDLDELLKLRAVMAQSLTGAVRTRYAATSKGC
jgi:hypothetical protein